MEKGNLRKIRNAIREYAQQEKIDPHKALNIFKQLKTSDNKDFLSDAITGLAGIREVKNKIGEDRYRIFKLVFAEKEKEVVEVWEERVDEVTRSPSPGENLVALLKFIYSSIDSAQEKTRTDERIREAFKGMEGELNTLIDTEKSWLKAMYKTLVFKAVPNENPQ